MTSFRKTGLALLAAICLTAALGISESLPGAAGTEQVRVESRHKPILTVDGLQFRDLNANGVLDPYEDWRLSPEERTKDLLSQMTLAEKLAQMHHPTFIPNKDGTPPKFLESWVRDKALGFILVRDLPSARAAAECMNQLQEWSEQSRLGIPIVISAPSSQPAQAIRRLASRLTGPVVPDAPHESVVRNRKPLLRSLLGRH